jgi:hypothetical protein
MQKHCSVDEGEGTGAMERVFQKNSYHLHLGVVARSKLTSSPGIKNRSAQAAALSSKIQVPDSPPSSSECELASIGICDFSSASRNPAAAAIKSRISLCGARNVSVSYYFGRRSDETVPASQTPRASYAELLESIGIAAQRTSNHAQECGHFTPFLAPPPDPAVLPAMPESCRPRQQPLRVSVRRH